MKSSFTFLSVDLFVEHQVSKSTIHFASLSFSKQVEKHYRDGTKEIIFPDQTIKYLYPNGAEECVFSDGTIQKINVEGEGTIEFPNGQRETHTKCYKLSGDTPFLFALCFENFQLQRREGQTFTSRLRGTDGIHFGVLRGHLTPSFVCENETEYLFYN